jgi:hypothetical protein
MNLKTAEALEILHDTVGLWQDHLISYQSTGVPVLGEVWLQEKCLAMVWKCSQSLTC